MTTNEIMDALASPFDPAKISWRVGATNKDKTTGIALAYIDARDVMYRLDEILGLAWQCKYSHAQGKTICDLGIKIDGEWIWRAGGAGDTDVEAEKGAISDAFKRAAVLFGIGRYLYSLPNEWVPIKPYGRSYALVNSPTLPKWATPDGWDKAMAKKALQTGVKHKPADSPVFAPDEAETVFLESVLDEVLVAKESPAEAAEIYYRKHSLDADEMTWIWNKLGEHSALRREMKKYYETNLKGKL